MRTITLPDGQVATEVPIVEAVEPWAELVLADGTVLRVRLVIQSVLRLEGQIDAMGRPCYAVESQNVLAVFPAAQ